MRKLIVPFLVLLGMANAVPVAAAGKEVSLVWDDGARSRCFQHIGQTREAIEKKQSMEVSDFKATECGVVPGLPKTCAKGSLWRNGPFMADGTCPAWFVQTHNWRASDRGQDFGWDFRAEAPSEGAPLLMTLVNNAAGDSNSCRQHEVNFNYNFADINFKPFDGRPARLGDFSDVVFSFDARVESATDSKCAKLPRSLVKLSFIVRWPGAGEAGGKWQSSVAVILFDNNGMLDVIAPEAGEDDGAIVFNNKCTIHAVYKSGTCMVSLDGAVLGLPVMDSTMRSYRISLTSLMAQYRDKLVESSGGKQLDLADAQFKTIQVISAVNGSDLTFQLQNPRLTGVPK